MNPGIISIKSLLVFVFLIKLTTTFSQQIPPNNEQTEYQPIDSLISFYEQKTGLRIYYLPAWFRNKKMHVSATNLSPEDFLYKLTETGRCSLVTLDSATFVLVLQHIPTRQDGKNEKNSAVLVGKMQEYGKYKKATLQGRIVDGKNGESLPGARLYIDQLKTGTSVNKSGEFSIELPVGDYEVTLSYMGYEESVRDVKLVSPGYADFEIFEKSVNLSEVTITSNRSDNNVSGNQMSLVKLDAKTINELPVSFGEVDILKSITLLPGIQSSGEFGTGFFVRGGGADQNLILLEDIPVFNSSHLFGLTSIINPDGISGITVYKAGIPARYGERASSVLDIRLGTDNQEKAAFKGGIGLINSRATLDLPLGRNKAHLFLGGRTTYSDWLLRKTHDVDLMNSSAGFSDLNGQLVYNINGNNKLSLFGYYSNDRMSIKNSTGYNYTNLIGSLRWNHIFNSSLFSSMIFGFSKYNYVTNGFDTLQRDETYKIKTSLLYKTLKYNVTWTPSTNHLFDFGLTGALYYEHPGELSPYNSLSLIVPVKLASEKALEFGLYASDNMNITEKLGAEIGLRYSGYRYLGPAAVYLYDPSTPKSAESIMDTVQYGKNKTIAAYSGFEPRIALKYAISDLSSIKMSYNRINQYINLVSNSTVINPADVWKLSNTHIKPLQCDQLAIGYFRNFNNNMYETSLELYYKTLTNIIEYKNGASLLVNPFLDADLLKAKGYNYGIELFIRKNTGLLTGWLTYAYSTSKRRTNGKTDVEQVNRNEYFPSVYDKPHNINLIGNYHISKRWRFSWTFSYNTGRPITLPEYRYSVGGNELVHYSDRNEYRLPDYHRLDVSITSSETLKVKKLWKGSWTFSIINLYGRKNYYSAYFQKEYPHYNFYALYIIGRPLPTITYNFSF
ncbi:MAG: TonB-dependent receptor [Bacteroidales bacterium]|nr:TonB-dependent receptor [Bacteroidales bacterium]